MSATSKSVSTRIVSPFRSAPVAGGGDGAAAGDGPNGCVGAGTGVAVGPVTGAGALPAAAGAGGGCCSLCQASIRKNTEIVNTMNRISRWVSIVKPNSLAVVL